MRKKKTTEEFKKELYKINPNIEILGEYINNTTRICCRCKIDGHEWSPAPTGLLSGKGCPKCSHKVKLTQDEFEQKLFKVNPNIKVMSKFIKYNEKIHCKCNVDGYEWDATPSDLIYNHRGCPVCNKYSHFAIKGYTDMWTTNPEQAKLLANPEDGYKYSQCSNKKVDWRCPNCGEIVKNKCINSVYSRGISCPACSDGIKYPEKFMYNLLQQLNVDFEYQYSPDWIKLKRYDFYIPSINCICETHGKQHYAKSNRGRSLQEEQKNDQFKEQLAKDNSITNYIVIDCRKSELEWIKNSVLNSELSKLFNLSNIDWIKCDKFAINTFVTYACNLWQSGINNTLEISKLMQLNRSTIIDYLNRGYKIGLCNYNAKEEEIKNGKKISIKNCKKVLCITTNETFESLIKAAIKYGINSSHIMLCCKHKRNYTGKLPDGTKLQWMYYDEYITAHKNSKQAS